MRRYPHLVVRHETTSGVFPCDILLVNDDPALPSDVNRLAVSISGRSAFASLRYAYSRLRPILECVYRRHQLEIHPPYGLSACAECRGKK